MALAKDAGFEGIEVDVSGDGPINLDSDEAAIDEVGTMAADARLALSGLAQDGWGIQPPARTRRRVAMLNE